MTRSIRISPALAAMLLAGALVSGCAAVAGGAAGGLIVDEGINENDGTFDPGENTELGREVYE